MELFFGPFLTTEGHGSTQISSTAANVKMTDEGGQKRAEGRRAGGGAVFFDVFFERTGVSPAGARAGNGTRRENRFYKNSTNFHQFKRKGGNIQRSTFNARRSTLNIRLSTCPGDGQRDGFGQFNMAIW